MRRSSILLAALALALVATGCAISAPSSVVVVALSTAPATLAPTTVAPTTTAAPPPPTDPAPTTSEPPPPPSTAHAPAPCAVSYIGDSVGTGILRNGLGDDLGGVDCPLVWNAAYGGMPLGDGATLLAGGGEAPSNVALVVIGYHNTRSEVAAGRFPARIDAIVGAAGGRLVVWPMLGSTPECSASYKRAVVRANEELQAALQRWSNLALVDYPTFLAGHDEYAVNDCPHLRAAGYRATATWLAGEVRGVVEHRRSAS